jgi:hypothetical protein
MDPEMENDVRSAVYEIVGGFARMIRRTTQRRSEPGEAGLDAGELVIEELAGTWREPIEGMADAIVAGLEACQTEFAGKDRLRLELPHEGQILREAYIEGICRTVSDEVMEAVQSILQ